MTYDPSAYDIAKIRELLTEAFTAEDLRRFCEDRPVFRPIARGFGPGMGLDDMVDRVIGYCRTQLLFPELLAEVKEVNPRQYARFEPDLRAFEPTPRYRPPPGKPRPTPARPVTRTWFVLVFAAVLLSVVIFVLAVVVDRISPKTTREPELPLTTDTDMAPLQTTTDTLSNIPPPCTATGETWTRPPDGAVMVCVPAGEFLMGSTDEDPDADSDEQPQHTVYLDAFWIDRTEVTNAQYRQCVGAGACVEPYYWDDDRYNAPDQPVVGVTWDDAQAYAVWVGGRLPTEAEWEKAARGTDGSTYPWGESAWDCSKANTVCVDRPLAVGSYPDGASPYGVLDMAGNVWEWVADWYDAEYYARSPLRNPYGPDSGDKRVMRGGAFDFDPIVVRCAYREKVDALVRYHFQGFRLVVARDDL